MKLPIYGTGHFELKLDLHSVFERNFFHAKTIKKI